jgi:hypothetical protein
VEIAKGFAPSVQFQTRRIDMDKKNNPKDCKPNSKCGCGCGKEKCDCGVPHEHADVTLLERLFDEDNDDNIILFDENGEEIELEQIAAVTHEGQIYAVLHVVGDPEEEVLVFHINADDEESVTMVEDENLGNTILKLVMEQSKNESKK